MCLTFHIESKSITLSFALGVGGHTRVDPGAVSRHRLKNKRLVAHYHSSTIAQWFSLNRKEMGDSHVIL